jgi:hypothetical protein
MDRYGIHPDCPIVWAKDWPSWHREGWRFECNLPTGRHKDNSLVVRSLQRHHGEENVTLGHAMSQEGPFVSHDWIGGYVRDVEVLVIELYRWMDSWGS